MSGSIPRRPFGINRVKKVLGIPEAPHYVLSPFRPELQFPTINVKNFLTSAAARTQQNILQNYVVENVRRAHVQSILLGSGIIVIGSTEAACEAFIEQYSNVCNSSQIALLLGTRKMSISKIEQILADFKSGKISVIVSTSILSMGLNVPRCYILLLYWACGRTINSFNIWVVYYEEVKMPLAQV
jgi:superfamily II DNA or RNA helicase